VSTTSTCSWTAASNSSWISVTSGAAGTGSGTVAFSYVANTGGSRTGTVTIGGRAFTVTQAATVTPPPSPPPPSPPPAPPSCAYSISPDKIDVDDDGGTRTINISTGGGCMWTARSNESWIAVDGAGGTGSGSTRITVARNDGKRRDGTVSVAGRTVRVEQDRDHRHGDDDDDDRRK
jgi:hypothetical protein